MDKRTKARLEREKLNEMIKSSPKLKAFLDAATDETENQDLKDLTRFAYKESILAGTLTLCNVRRRLNLAIRWSKLLSLCPKKFKRLLIN